VTRPTPLGSQPAITDDFERTTTHEVINAMAVLAERQEDMPLAAITYGAAEPMTTG
jgi:adenylosuccinate lyase